MIGSVNGVIIWTQNLDRLTKFYTETMGLTPHSVRPHFVNFEWGEMRFSIGSHTEIKGQAADPYRIMINFDVTDIHATILKQLGLDSRQLEIPGRKRLEVDHGKPIDPIIA